MEFGPDSISSAQREIDANNRKDLYTKLGGATEQEKKRYYDLLNAARRNRQGKDGPGLVTISTEERLGFIEKAISGEDIEALTKPQDTIKVDPIDMERKWDTATLAQGGRPPIGGAVDD